MKRKQVEAGLLNFLIWGIGYLYIGQRKVFGILAAIGFVVTQLGILLSYNNLLEAPFSAQLSVGVGLVVVGLAFAADAFQTTPE